VQAIYPNEDYERGKIGPVGKKWSSCWFELNDDVGNKFLRESGYEEFPVLAPRWFVLPGDVYGRGPGWNAIGDAKMLQYLETRLMNMTDKLVNPPMRVSQNIKRVSLLPGDRTDMPRGDNSMAEPMMVVDPNGIVALREHIMRTEDRIKRSMYVHLWNNMIDDQRNQRPTATEVEARRQEIMLMLGPLLENMNGSLLEPAIDRTFAIMMRSGRLPPPPPEVQGEDVTPEFVSVMHQMQQATGLAGINTTLQYYGIMAQMKPEVLDNLNVDILAEEIIQITGVRPDAQIPPDEVAAMREQRAQMEQAKQMAEQAEPITKVRLPCLLLLLPRAVVSVRFFSEAIHRAISATAIQDHL
jgi:hypothetical protein